MFRLTLLFVDISQILESSNLSIKARMRHSVPDSARIMALAPGCAEFPAIVVNSAEQHMQRRFAPCIRAASSKDTPFFPER